MSIFQDEKDSKICNYLIILLVAILFLTFFHGYQCKYIIPSVCNDTKYLNDFLLENGPIENIQSILLLFSILILLSLINKIQLFRETYYEDPKVIFFDFPRAADSKKVMAATALMEDAKSGHLETTFGGNHKEIEISNVHVVVLGNTAPDLSVLSVDRWRLWRLGGEEYDNIMCSLFIVL